MDPRVPSLCCRDEAGQVSNRMSMRRCSILRLEGTGPRRHRRTRNMFEQILHDLRHGFRLLRKYPAFSLAIIVTVALGLGANATIFGVINAVLLEPLPYSEPDRLVRLWENNPKQNQPEFPVSVPNFQDWQR